MTSGFGFWPVKVRSWLITTGFGWLMTGFGLKPVEYIPKISSAFLWAASALAVSSSFLFFFTAVIWQENFTFRLK